MSKITIENYYAYSSIGTKSVTFAEGNRACVVVLALGDTGGINNPVSATCDGSSMTLAESETASYVRTKTYIWYTLNPGIGAKNVVVSYTPSGTPTYALSIFALSGVYQNGPIAQTKDAYNCYAAGTYNMIFSTADPKGLMVSAGSSYATNPTAPSGYTINNQNKCKTAYKLAPAKNETVTWVTDGNGNSFCATAFAAAPDSGSQPAISPFFNFFKNFENPWNKKGGIWQPGLAGI